MNKPTRTIVTIGGGNSRTQSTLTIDTEIVRLSGKKKPNFLFIPTASSDNENYVEFMRKIYGDRLGCKTDVLYLLRDKPSLKTIREKILNADIIYVGGGNTLMMMNLWRRLGVDKLLEKAWKQGTVMCGLSAGSICWYESGHSDSRSFHNPDNWKYINVRGLGFLQGIHCPHFDSDTLGIPRKKHFEDMMLRLPGMGIAIDDNCAMVFQNDRYRVIDSKKTANAYRLWRKRGVIIVEKIPKAPGLTPVAQLYTK